MKINILTTQPVFDSPIAAIFIVGDCSLSLVQGKDPLPENTGRMEVYWEVDDIDAAYNKLIENGAQSLVPVKQIFNIKIAKVIDPFGNTIGLSGKNLGQEKRTIEDHPSETAMTVAFYRALANKDDREEIKGPDYLAESFLTDEAKKLLVDSNSSRSAINNLVSSQLYGYLIARTAFIDEIFKTACKENIPQIVFLGAGYDTRAYRYNDEIFDTKIFEVDIKSTQQKKINDLNKAGIKIPAGLTFVEINFKNEKLEDILLNAGYDKNRKTLFIWEGVMYYLTHEAVDGTLHFIIHNSCKDSTVCFDYLNEKLESINEAEPFQFWISKDNIESFITEHGFKIITHLDSNEMEKRYLKLKDGSLAAKAVTRFGFIHASVNN